MFLVSISQESLEKWKIQISNGSNYKHVQSTLTSMFY